MGNLIDDIAAQLAQLQERKLLRRRRAVDGPQGPYLTVEGERYLAFCSNDYLGLANHPALIAAAHRGLDHFGVGASASALISGHSSVMEQLEAALAAFVGMPRALHFSNGYMANIGIVPALAGRGDSVFSDSLNHACLIDGARLSKADVQIYSIGILEPLTGRGRTMEEMDGPALLNDIADESGGRLFEVDNLNILPDVASKIGTALRNQYILGYAPPDGRRDGKYHKIQVKIARPAGVPPLRASFRAGYTAPSN